MAGIIIGAGVTKLNTSWSLPSYVKWRKKTSRTATWVHCGNILMWVYTASGTMGDRPRWYQRVHSLLLKDSPGRGQLGSEQGDATTAPPCCPPALFPEKQVNGLDELMNWNKSTYSDLYKVSETLNSLPGSGLIYNGTNTLYFLDPNSHFPIACLSKEISN